MQLRSDISGFRTFLTDELIAARTAAGIWQNRTIAQIAAEQTAADPSATLLIEGDVELSRSVILERARRLGAALRRRGLKPGDVVAFQLPNWHETAVIHMAAAIEGFVLNPIVPIYRDLEMKFILAEGRARVFVTTETFRKFNYLDMVRRIRGELPLLDQVVVVRGGHGEFTQYETLIGEAATGEPSLVDPNAVKLLMYTSGTTGPAKGVLHTHNTILVEALHYAQHWAIGEQDTLYTPSSVCHIGGVTGSLEVPWALGTRAILSETWQADAAIAAMLRHRVTIFIGATVFLQEMLDAAQRANTTLPLLRLCNTGGASIPPGLIRRAHRELPHCITGRSFGATEVSSITYGVMLEDDLDRAALTDGRIGADWSVKIVDTETGAPLPAGQDGEILARGGEMLVGYSRAEDSTAALDEEGYFRTGDIGRLVDEHYLLITDRKKDIIIRGGENISSREIEDALHNMPGIGPVAAVAMPSPRMGETVCLFVEAGAGRRVVGLPEVTAFLQTTGIARQKLPERVEMIGELPRNPSGKVRKNVLRQLIAEKIAAEQART